MAGRLIVFEGPDGVGKTTLSLRAVDWLNRRGTKAIYVSLPGSQPGTLGKLIYEIHHDPAAFGCSGSDPAALQLLHVAAHVDAVNRIIRPALMAGESVVMDRFWWSMVAYSRVSAVDERPLELMVHLEHFYWSDLSPLIVFLLDRSACATDNQPANQRVDLRTAYSHIALAEQHAYKVKRISRKRTPDETFAEVMGELENLELKDGAASSPRQRQLSFNAKEAPAAGPTVFSKLSPARPSKVYDTYWRFATMRQEVFFQRLRNEAPPWTEDPILRRYKFTNAYRASDRVSQYLIHDVIYQGPQDPENLLFRTLLFKIFNKIETWKLLEEEIGELRVDRFDLNAFDAVLTQAMQRKQAIYSAAYIMPSGGREGSSKKHVNHLRLLKKMLSDRVAAKLRDSKSMRSGFDLLLSYPMIGKFLAYQYITDLNYSCLTDFSEAEFVVPGPGARDGIRKCFDNLGGLSEADVIKMVADRQSREFERLGLKFRSLWGRRLQLIDCQNLFCEVDKYARQAHPEVSGLTGRKRIKQMFHRNPGIVRYWYPPKWGINDLVAQDQEDAYAHR